MCIRDRLIADALSSCSWVHEVLEVETNIVVAVLNHGCENDQFINRLKENGILAIPFGKGRIRMVTHLDVKESDVNKVIDSLKF